MFTLLVWFLLLKLSCQAAAVPRKAVEESTISVLVSGGITDCYYQAVNKSRISGISVAWSAASVRSDNYHDVLIYNFTHPKPIYNGSNLFSGIYVHDDSVDVAEEYKICFFNRGQYQKTFTLSIVLVHASNSPAKNASSSELSRYIDMALWRLKEKLNEVESQQQRKRRLELADRSIAETNFEIINFFGSLGTLAMFVSAVTQVFLVRTLLTREIPFASFFQK